MEPLKNLLCPARLSALTSFTFTEATNAMEHKLAEPAFTDALMLAYGSPRMAAFFRGDGRRCPPALRMRAWPPCGRRGSVGCSGRATRDRPGPGSRVGRGLPRDLRSWVDSRVRMTRRAAPRHANMARSIKLALLEHTRHRGHRAKTRSKIDNFLRSAFAFLCALLCLCGSFRMFPSDSWSCFVFRADVHDPQHARAVVGPEELFAGWGRYRRGIGRAEDGPR
jgi:hypothetical protein